MLQTMANTSEIDFWCWLVGLPQSGPSYSNSQGCLEPARSSKNGVTEDTRKLMLQNSAACLLAEQKMRGMIFAFIP